MNPLISIIIPVYNSEKYLHKCISSILNQSFPNIEIILINDGSTDKSLDICNNYALIDSRIKIFTTPNRGVSAARNIGLNMFTGDYVTFIDSDDYIGSHYLSNLYDEIELRQADIVMSGHTSFLDDRKITVEFESKVYSKSDFLNSFYLFYPNLTNSPWGKLIRRDLIVQNKLLFPENMLKFEDIYFNIDVFNQANVISIIDCTDYYYRHTSNSLMKKFNTNEFDLYESVFLKIRDILTLNKAMNEKNLLAISSNMFYRYSWALHQLLKQSQKSGHKSDSETIEGYFNRPLFAYVAEHADIKSLYWKLVKMAIINNKHPHFVYIFKTKELLKKLVNNSKKTFNYK